MAKAHIYLAAGANVEATDTFASWIDTTNSLVYDMGTVVLTSVSQPQPNVTVGGYTSGNAHLQGIFSANTVVVSNGLRGGSVSGVGDLTVVSNTIFSESPLVRISANTDNFTVNSNNTTFTSNVAINSSKTVLISAANTTINAGQLFVRTNSEFTGTRVDIDGTTFDVTSNAIFTSATFNANVDVITLGFNGSDSLVVNAVSDFNANVNIDGVLFNVTSTNTTIGDAGTDKFNVIAESTFSANATFNGALVNITSANTTIGDAPADRLNVNAVSDFNANVNIDGILTQTANAVFSGALVNITSANTTIGDAPTDVLNVNATSDFNANVNIDGILTQTANVVFSGALVNITSANTTIGDAPTDALNVNAVSDFNANVNVDGIFTVANSATVSNTLTVNTQANTASLMVRDLTATRIAYVATAGEIVDSANLTFSGTNLNVIGTANVTSNANVGGTFGVTGATTLATTTIGSSGSIELTVNAKSGFNANVNIDGLLTQTANATFSGALVNITSANTTIGDAPTDVLNVNAISDFNANVNVDGILTVANSATVSNTLTVNTQANTASLMVRDLTATRIPYVATAGEVVDSANLTFSGTNLNIIGTANVTSNANVGGTLGVTGVATFSSNAVFSDNDYIVVGTGADLQIYHDGSHSYITDAGTGNLKIDASQLDIQTSNSTATETMATFVRDGAVTLFHDNITRLATSGTGVSVTGTLGVSTNATVSGTLNVAGVTTLANTTVGAAPTDVFNINAISDFNANVNVDGMFTVANSATISNTLTVNTQANTASLMVRDLTATRIPYVGVSGEIVDSANVTFSGTNLNVIGTANVTSNANVGGTFGVTGATALANTVTVTGTATFANTVTVTGNTTVTALNASGLVDVTNATDATSTTAAALKTAGGLAVAKKLYVGGIVEASANVNITGTGNRISAPDAAISNNMTVGGTATINNLTVTGTTILNTGDAQLSLNNATTAHSTVTDDLTLTNATIIGSVVPDVNNSYDIGTGSLNWKTVYANNVVANVAWANITDKPDPVVTVTLTGDVQGTASATLTDLSSNTISVSTTIQPNSVALGTDTTGNYVGTLSVTTPGTANGSSGLTFTGVAGEGTIAAIAHANTSTVTNLSVDNSAGNVLQDISLTFDAFGHVTGRTITSTDLDLRYPQTSFTNIAVTGQSTVISDSLTDTLTLVGAGITTITTNATTDTITITATEADTLASVTSRGNTTSNSITVNDINARDIILSGNLTVSGTTTYINTAQLNVGDNLISLNADYTGSSPSENAGIEVERGTVINTAVLWNESTDRWTFTNDGTNYFNIPTPSEYNIYNSWTIQDGDTTSYTITSGDTLQIASGTYITSNFTDDDILTISHNNTTRTDTTSSVSPNYAGTFTTVDGVTTNAQGHVTAVNVKTVTMPSSNNTTYDMLAVANTVANAGILRLKDSANANDDVIITGSGGATVSSNATHITVSSTTYSNGAGIGLTGTVFSHLDTSSALDLTASSRRYVTGLTFDTYGHVTGYTTGNETVVDTNTTYDLLAVANTVANAGILRLRDSASVNDDVLITGTGTVTVSSNATHIVVNSPSPAGTNLTATAGSTSGPVINSSTGTGFTFPSASSTASGIITTGAQNIAGVKTFDSTISGSINGNAATATTLTSLTATVSQLNFANTVTSNIQTQLDAKQPLDSDLTAIAALAVTDGNFIVGNGTTWVAENGATARTSLGLGTIATQAASSVTITGGSITGITDLAIADGGTGASTAAQALINFGLSSTAAQLNFANSVTSNIQTQLNAKAPIASPTFTGDITANGGIISSSPWDAAIASSQIYLNGTTGNRIGWNSNGVGAPAFTTRSAGAKLVLVPSITASLTDYAIGIETSAMWSSVSNTNGSFKWYGGTTLAATLTGTGDFTVVGTVTSPTLRLTATTDVSLVSTGHAFQIGVDTSANLVIDNNEIQARNNGAAATLALNKDGGSVTAGGDFTATGDVTAFSDERLKTNIRTIDNALSKVEQLRGVYFDKDGKAGTGVIAQEIEKVLPEVVLNGEEYKSVAYGNIVGLLIEAIKELQAKVEELEKKG